MLAVADSYLTISVLNASLSLDEISKDFTAPSDPYGLGFWGSLISSAFFVVGGVIGVVGATATEIAVKAGTAAASRTAAAKKAVNKYNSPQAKEEFKNDPERLQYNQQKAQRGLEAAESAKASRSESVGRVSGAAGAATVSKLSTPLHVRRADNVCGGSGSSLPSLAP